MKKLIKSKLFLQVIVASMVATLATVGIVAATTTIGANINTGGTLDVTGVSTLTGNTTIGGTLGVTGASTLTGNTTVAGTLGVTGQLNFVNASSTGWLKVATIKSDTGAISFDNENLTTTGSMTAATTTISTGDFTVGTTDFYVDDDNARVGISSSTPTAKLSVGASTAATTTLDFAKPCFRMTTDNGTLLYYWPSLATGVLGGWATSTISCF
ncbi:MAG: hypothetical protein PHF50_01995 [Patescibacteria group bacterium]|nr:hypothetical protein [Patescibacteria group bacterium]